MQYIASLSYGKDSLAMLHVICDVLKLPLTRIITADVWATETIPAELPPMVEFKEKADRIIKERWGIEVEHFCATKKNGTKNSYNSQFYTKVCEKRINKRTEVFAEPHTCHNPGGKIDIYGFPMRMGAWCNSKLKIEALNNAKKTYEDVFYHVRESGKREGQIAGFPYQNAPECNSELKRPVFKEIEKQARGVVQYIGIAADEPKRIERHQKKEGISMPLVDAGWTEQMCRDWCKENELLSPIYTTSARGGVGFVIIKASTSCGSCAKIILIYGRCCLNGIMTALQHSTRTEKRCTILKGASSGKMTDTSPAATGLHGTI